MTAWKKSFNPYDLEITSIVTSKQKEDDRCVRDFTITSLCIHQQKLIETGDTGKIFDLENIFEDPIYTHKNPITALCTNQGHLIAADNTGTLFLPLQKETLISFHEEITALTSNPHI